MTGLYRVLTAGLILFSCFAFRDQAVAHPVGEELVRDLIGPVETAVIRSDGLPIQTYRFNQSGQLVSASFDITDSKNDTSWPRVMRFSYEARRRVKAEFSHNDGSFRLVTAYVYDLNGQPSAEVTAYDNGALSEALFLIYDDQGHKIRELYFERDRGLTEKRIFENGREKIRHYRVDGFSTDPTGAIQNETNWFVVQPEYDSDGLLQKSKNYSEGSSVIHTTQYKYNIQGKVSERLHYSDQQILRMKVTYSYEYDSVGNWTRLHESSWSYINDTISPVLKEYVYERRLTYYHSE